MIRPTGATGLAASGGVIGARPRLGEELAGGVGPVTFDPGGV